MKKILVPTDFSDCANAAVDLALYLAAKAQAEIHFLHLLMTPVDWVQLPLEKEDLYPETKEKIGKVRFMLDELAKRAEAKGIKSHVSLVFDRTSEDLTRHLGEFSHDFVVIGSNGTTEQGELIGSNAQRIIRYANTPVLVIKDKIEEYDLKSIVFACAFDEDVEAPFERIQEFANIVGAHIYLLYVNTPYDFQETDVMENKMMNLMSKCDIGMCSINIYNALDEESGIEKFARQINANLIAMTTHGKKGFLRVISPSIAESLVNHSRLPVLSVNYRT